MARSGSSDELDGYVDVAVRAWTVGENQPAARTGTPPGASRAARVPEYFLVFDTETTTDATQRLLIGSWRYLRTRSTAPLTLECVEEGVFYADDLEQFDPAGHAVIEDLKAARSPATIDSRAVDAARTLRVEPLRWFLDQRLWRAAYELHGALVCFNFPFDISRLAWKAGAARNRRPDGRDPFEGGFSLALWGYERDGKWKESRHRPRVAVKSIDSKRALKAFRNPEKVDAADLVPDDSDPNSPRKGSVFQGQFLDLRTLVFALTDRGHTLESACDAFAVPYTKREAEHGTITREYIDYCREDTDATSRLCEAANREFLKHPIDLPATRAFSPATIGKGYLKKMGLRPPLQRQTFDPRFLGHCMTAYFGGRAEARIRRTHVPVAYCDFLSMYPTVCTLMGLWNLLTSAEIEVQEDSAESVRELLDSLTVEACLDPAIWPRLVGIAEIEPDGDIVPVRARYGASPNWQIGINHLHSSDPMWFTIADLAASKLLTGKTPKILDATTLRRGASKLPGLHGIELLGETQVDPTSDDFFRTVVEERRRVQARPDLTEPEREWRTKGLKVLANSTSYGIYAQMTRHELSAGKRETVRVHGLPAEPYRFAVTKPEDPGEYAFPPLAAAITGGARLMLAALERLVTDQGGTYAFCDTDSMAIVSNQTGGLIACPGGGNQLPDGTVAVKALSWTEIDEIRHRFERLKPYNAETVTDDLLELEDENYTKPEMRRGRRELWCFAISAKRYVLYDRDHERSGPTSSPDPVPVTLLKPSEHGLGHLLDPTDSTSPLGAWIADAWTLLLAADHLDLGDGPRWLDRPALAQISVSSPHVHRLFAGANSNLAYSAQVKPFNFLLAAFVPRAERPADDQRMVLIAPYERDPDRWADARWHNRSSGREYRLTQKPFDGYVRPRTVRPRSYRDVLSDYLNNPEPKSAAPDGQPCRPDSRGLLRRRTIRVGTLTHVGKESNQLEDVQSGLTEDIDEALLRYDDDYSRVFVPLVKPVLKALGVRETARRSGLSVGAVSAALNGSSRPRAKSLDRLLTVAAEHCRNPQETAGFARSDQISAIRRFLDA